MKKLLAIIAIAFAVAIGTAAVMTTHPQHAEADPNGGCTGSGC